MGDRWRPSLLGSSTYIWYPLSWNTGVPQIVHADVWSLNINAGTYTAAAGASYEAESGTLSGTAVLASGSGFSGGKCVGYLGHGGSVTINNVQGIGGNQWVSLYYANGKFTTKVKQLKTSIAKNLCNAVQRIPPGATLPLGLLITSLSDTETHLPCSANGGPSILVDQPNTGGAQTVISVPVLLNLRSGANSITIGASQSSKIFVPGLLKVSLNRLDADYAADLDKIVVYTAT